MKNTKTVKKGKWKRGDPEVTKRKTDGENGEDGEEERGNREAARHREKQMVAEKRQIQTH